MHVLHALPLQAAQLGPVPCHSSPRCELKGQRPRSPHPQRVLGGLRLRLGSDADYVSPDDDASALTSSATPEPGQSPSMGPGTLLTPEQPHPDWAWLAAARIVAECKLRQHVDAEDIAKLEDWNNLREGAWVPEPPRPGLGDPSGALVEVQEPEPEEPREEWRKHERDWAGAEGIWRLVFDVLVFSPLISNSRRVDVSCAGSTTMTLHVRYSKLRSSPFLTDFSFPVDHSISSHSSHVLAVLTSLPCDRTTTTCKTRNSMRHGSPSRCPSVSPATPLPRSRSSSPTGRLSTSKVISAAADELGASTASTRMSTACTARLACSPTGTSGGPRYVSACSLHRTSGY